MIPPKVRVPFQSVDKRSYSELPTLSVSVQRGTKDFVRESWELEASGFTIEEAMKGIQFLHSLLEHLSRGDKPGAS